MAFIRQPMSPGMLYDAAIRIAADAPADADDRDVIAEMGWPLVLIAEAAGGMGGTLADLTAIVEGLAAHGSQLPVIERCAIAPLLLQAAPANPWLAGLAEGTMNVAPLIGGARDLAAERIAAQPVDGGYRLDGTIRGVCVASSPTHWLVLARIASEGSGAAVRSAIFVLDAGQLSVPCAAYASMDGRRTADFELSGLTVAAERCIATGDAADAAITQAGQAALAMICVDTVAALGTMVEQTVTYLNDRVQFGAALSSFQALRHQLVDVYIRYESGRGMITSFLADAGRDATGDARRLSLIKLALGEGARFSGETVIQLHGGMGMTEETPAARLAQRVLANEFRFGDRFAHSATLSLRPEPVPA